MLDSLREEIFKEELMQQSKHLVTENVPKDLYHQQMLQKNLSSKQKNAMMPSPAANSMPFELRDSIPSNPISKSDLMESKMDGSVPFKNYLESDALMNKVCEKFTDSQNDGVHHRAEDKSSSVVCYANEKRLLSNIGQKVRQSASSAEGHHHHGHFNYQEQSAQTQLRVMQKNDLTLSQKDFDKKSQMMRLSELDSVSGGGGCPRKDHVVEQEEVVSAAPRTQKIGKIPAVRKIKGAPDESSSNGGLQSSHIPRNRAPSENQALEREPQHLQHKSGSDKDKQLMSPHTFMTNGTDSIGGSLQTQSLLGEKSRMSAPVTIPAKAAAKREAGVTT